MSSRTPRTYFKSFGSVGRHWYKRKVPEHFEKTKNLQFTVASYNILADQLMEDNPHLYYDGKSKNAKVFEWKYRKHNLLKEIEHANADILCLQEVEEDHYYDWFNPHLQLSGYSGVYKKRSGDKPDGCAIFFKDDVFTLQLCHMVDFYRKYIPMCDRNNVAIIVFLTPTSSSTLGPICVTNTHILFNKNRGDIKLTQLAHLFADVDALAKVHATDYKYVPIIMCGDFNSLPGSPLYSLVTTGELQYEGLNKCLVSGQTHGHEDRYHAFGDVLFPSDIGLSNKCKWTKTKRERTLDEFLNPTPKRTRLNDFNPIAIKSTLSFLCNKFSETTEPIKRVNKRTKLKSNLHNGGSDDTVVSDVDRVTSLHNGGSDVIVISDEENEPSDTSSKLSNMSNELVNNPVLPVTDQEKELSNMLRKHNIIDNPIVVIIDCNSKSYNPLVPTDSDEAEDSKPGYLTHDFTLESSYVHYCLDGQPEISTCHDRDAANVDYIFYSCEPSVKNPDVQRLKLSGVLGLLPEPDLIEMDKLPNRYLSSDHLMLMAQFTMCE